MRDDFVDICVVEDDATERALLRRRFLGAGYEIIEACDGEAGLEAIRRHHPHVVICDVLMPGDLSGIDVCEAIRADKGLSGTYVILITAYDSQKRKRDALLAGADDYLIKPYDAVELEAKVRNGLRISQLQERLRHAALTDGLTGLWNHAQFRDILDREFSRQRRYGGDMSLLMIDLDFFKAVNDTYGHEVGNRVLKLVSQHLRNSVRDTDTVARYGGEEFSVVCPETTLADAAQLANRIRETLPGAVHIPGHPELEVHASMGVASLSDARVLSSHDLVQQADQALYLAKKNGRNQVRCCNELTDEPQTEVVRVDEVDRLRKEVVSLNMQAKEMCLQSVWALVQALEARDPYTAEHSRNVTFYVERCVETDNWPTPMRAAVANAAMLHDLGKIGVPDRVLQKPGTLTPDEMAMMRRVSLMTCKILEPLRIFETEIVIVRYLRERFDGAGYPEGLKGERIPVGSRLLAVAEAFDSLTTDRAHRSGCDIDDALETLKAGAGSQFDPRFVKLLADTYAQQKTDWRERIRKTNAAQARLLARGVANT